MLTPHRLSGKGRPVHFFKLCFLQLYCGNSGCIPLGKQTATGSRYPPYWVQAGCFSVSIIHRTLTWTAGSLTCTQMLMHAICTRGCADTGRESALKVDSGEREKKSLAAPGNRTRVSGVTVRCCNQLSYIPTQLWYYEELLASPNFARLSALDYWWSNECRGRHIGPFPASVRLSRGDAVSH